MPSAEVKPLTASMSDVLPAPFGPIRPVTVPGSSRKLTSFDGDHRAVPHRQTLDGQRPGGDPRVVVAGGVGVGDVGELDRVRPAPLPRLLDRRDILTHSAATPSL